jgi:hypothetical protein
MLAICAVVKLGNLNVPVEVTTPDATTLPVTLKFAKVPTEVKLLVVTLLDKIDPVSAFAFMPVAAMPVN